MKEQRDFSPLVMDTSNIPESDRFEYWREFVSRRVIGVVMDSPRRANYWGRLEDYKVDQASALFIDGDESTAVRTAREIAQTSNSETRWVLLRPVEPILISQAGIDVPVAPGELFLIDTERPYSRPQSVLHGNAMAFSDAFMKSWGLNGEDCVGRSFKLHKGWPMLLSAYMGALTPELIKTAAQDGAAGASLVQHVLSLLVQTVGQECAGAVSPYPEDSPSLVARRSLYNRMLAWMSERYMEQGLEAKGLALSFGVSVRYVHKIFAEFGSGRSFLQSLQNIRLERACHFLADPRQVHVVVAEVAWRCGYDDVSSFGRLFKARFGLSPGAYRMIKLGRGSEGGE
jgi:AraC-like DNA-binding protein